MDAVYDDIGRTYSVTRRTDPRLAKRIHAELSGASRIVNIGAGTGSYEPEDAALVAVEPSSRMIAQREPGSYPVEQAFAEKLPFKDRSFSHAMTVLSMHHWKNRALAFGEINRVTTEKFVAVTWDPAADPFWLTRDYFPDIYETDRRIFPKPEELLEHFDEVHIAPLPIPDDCRDGVLAAFWKRPEAYLNSTVRRSISAFAGVKNVSAGLRTLQEDLASGTWAERNRDVLHESSLDVGYRIISARVRAT